MKKLVLTLGIAMLLIPAAGFADWIDFSVQLSSGATGSSWSWDGTTLTVSSAPDSYVNVSSSASGTTMYFLNQSPQFQTTSGDESSYSAYTDTNGHVITTVGFDPGGQILIAQDSAQVCQSTGCFTGEFTGAQFLTSGNGYAFSATFVGGQVDPGLLAALGLPTGTTEYNGVLTISLSGLSDGVTFGENGCRDSAGGLVQCGTFGSADLRMEPVPEPGTLALLGTGLLGMAGFLRRKLWKS
jgi:hypothetical protein